MKYSGIVSVFGGREVSNEIYRDTLIIGKKLAKENYLVFCGGGYGVMEAISRGVKEGGGTCVGILKGKNREEANKYLSYSIPTGVDIGRNVILAYSCDIAIAISGKFGTLSEIAHTLSLGKNVVGYNTWDIESVEKANSPEDVIDKVKEFLSK